MFNKIKYLLLVFVIGIVSIVGTKSVNALPESISGVNAGSLISYDGGPRLYHKTYGNGVVFCTTFYVQGVGSNCKLSADQWSYPVAAGIAAIIEKYNAAPSVRNYYNAELAINRFLYDYETKASVNNVRSVTGVQEFYDAAVAAYNEAKKDFDISLSTDKLTFTLNGDNYVSNKVTVSGSDKYSINISGVEGATYEESGNDFYIKVPSTSVKDGETVTVNVKVSASKSVSIAKKYDCGTGNQNITINDIEKSTKTKDADISGQITKEKKITKLRISKQDLANKKELPGATLILKNAKGKEVDKWVSGDKPHYVENLEPGKYTLTEIIAPEGYKLSEETVEFELKADNKVTVKFEINLEGAIADEAIYLVGNTKELGNWDVTKAKALKKNKNGIYASTGIKFRLARGPGTIRML